MTPNAEYTEAAQIEFLCNERALLQAELDKARARIVDLETQLNAKGHA